MLPLVVPRNAPLPVIRHGINTDLFFGGAEKCTEQCLYTDRVRSASAHWHCTPNLGCGTPQSLTFNTRLLRSGFTPTAPAYILLDIQRSSHRRTCDSRPQFNAFRRTSLPAASPSTTLLSWCGHLDFVSQKYDSYLVFRQGDTISPRANSILHSTSLISHLSQFKKPMSYPRSHSNPVIHRTKPRSSVTSTQSSPWWTR